MLIFTFFAGFSLARTLSNVCYSFLANIVATSKIYNNFLKFYYLQYSKNLNVLTHLKWLPTYYLQT